ncbi:hypothetical protein EU527_17765 [Candidatus Thorarchaeota archaeon]|nr:MAG: hypothetical protein EU527_17765 [Candidatus Thorarchaeota archaeon]
MSSDNKKSDEYWMGVRDALRMVDSFNKWASRNPGRAKSLEDFIHDGLIAAAKRCESCLQEKLGLTFAEEDRTEQDFDEIPVMGDESQDFEITPVFDEPSETHDDTQDYESSEDNLIEQSSYASSDFSYEMPLEVEPVESESEPELGIEDSETFEEEPPSVDDVDRVRGEPLDDVDTEGPSREFTTDFVLLEPTPLVVDEQETDSIASEESGEPLVADDGLKDDDEQESEKESIEVPSFTWADYETAVTPSIEPEPEPSDSETDILPPMDDESDEFLSEDTEITEPPEPPKFWSQPTESSISNDDAVLDRTDEDEIDDEEQETNGSTNDENDVRGPPPPPPPPESEEDEEERRRRARRLFFGA